MQNNQTNHPISYRIMLEPSCAEEQRDRGIDMYNECREYSDASPPPFLPLFASCLQRHSSQKKSHRKMLIS